MRTSSSVAQAVAVAAVDLDDAFEIMDEPFERPAKVVLFPHHAGRPAPKTLSECVPLLAVTLEFIDRGAGTITIDSVERYRADAIRLIENIRPVVERSAGMTLAGWAASRFPGSKPADIVARLTDAFEIVVDNPADELASSTPASLAECVPLLAIALEFISRGPCALTIENLEHYRTNAMRLLRHIGPSVEAEARRSLASWTRALQGEFAGERLAS